jgi:hypothetical protein
MISKTDKRTPIKTKLSSMLVKFGILLLATSFASSAAVSQESRSLSFADRVAYQRAIENVYWQRRIWPRNRGERPDSKPSLEAVMSQAELEKKVTEYLHDSQTLEKQWQRSITAEQLQAEMIAWRNTADRPRCCVNSLLRWTTTPMSSPNAWPGQCS